MQPKTKPGLRRRPLRGERPRRQGLVGEVYFNQLVELARAALPYSRPMADWEKRHADEFFWSQFTTDSSPPQYGPPAQ